MKRICIAFLATMFAPVTFAQNGHSDQLRKSKVAAHEETFIATFAQQAKEKNTETVLKEIDQALIDAAGEPATRVWLAKQIFPFFENFAKLDKHKTITNAALPDGRTGLWHYTYMVDTNGKVLPFSIAIIEVGDVPRVSALTVNQCIPNRHPFCK